MGRKVTILSSGEEDAETPSLRTDAAPVKRRKKSTGKRRIDSESDSDPENPLPKKARDEKKSKKEPVAHGQDIRSMFGGGKPSATVVRTNKEEKTIIAPLTSATAFFGTKKAHSAGEQVPTTSSATKPPVIESDYFEDGTSCTIISTPEKPKTHVSKESATSDRPHKTSAERTSHPKTPEKTNKPAEKEAHKSTHKTSDKHKTPEKPGVSDKHKPHDTAKTPEKHIHKTPDKSSSDDKHAKEKKRRSGEENIETTAPAVPNLLSSHNSAQKKDTAGSAAASRLKKKMKIDAEVEFDFNKKSPKKSVPHLGKSDEPLHHVHPVSEAQKKSFNAFMHREAPQALGTKAFPDLTDDCLSGLTFVLTGVCESFDRDEMKVHLEAGGGKVTSAVSGRTSYLVAGRDAGASKLAKAASCGVPQLDEDGLLEFVKCRADASRAGTLKTNVGKAKTPAKKAKLDVPDVTKTSKSPLKPVSSAALRPVTPSSSSIGVKPVTPSSSTGLSQKKATVSPDLYSSTQSSSASRSASATGVNYPATAPKTTTSTTSSLLGGDFSKLKAAARAEQQKKGPRASNTKFTGSGSLWVDRYAPKKLADVVGQQGDRSAARKLVSWLRGWEKNAKISKPDNATGVGCKAALISGPPGIGKTTIAHLAALEVGLSAVELNASDARNRKSLDGGVMEALHSRSLSNFAHGGAGTGLTRQCVIMDEVDGMSGNQDRGGVAELIQLLKKSQVPLICICNDRSNPKIRSLSNYCFDLRVHKPRVEQVVSALTNIARTEGVQISSQTLTQIAEATNHDIRQSVGQLQLLSANTRDAQSAVSKKDLKLNIFEAARRLFAEKLDIRERTDLFFQDYSFMPLFAHENYLHCMPPGVPHGKMMGRAARAAQLFSQSDVLERRLRSSQDWSLLQSVGLMSTVYPTALMCGRQMGQTIFPMFFGKLSKMGRLDRLLQQLVLHSSLVTATDKAAMNMDYLPVLQSHLLKLFQSEDNIPKIISLLQTYSLLKDDLELISELTEWAGKPSFWSKVDSKMKASLTRQYNKAGILTPYSITGPVSKRAKPAPEPGVDEDDIEEEEAEDETDISKDAMVKVKKRPAAAAAKPSARGGKAPRGGKKK